MFKELTNKDIQDILDECKEEIDKLNFCELTHQGGTLSMIVGTAVIKKIVEINQDDIINHCNKNEFRLIVNKEQSINFFKENKSSIKSIERLGSCYLEDYLNKYIIFVDGILKYTNNDEVFYKLYSHINLISYEEYINKINR